MCWTSICDWSFQSGRHTWQVSATPDVSHSCTYITKALNEHFPLVIQKDMHPSSCFRGCIARLSTRRGCAQQFQPGLTSMLHCLAGFPQISSLPLCVQRSVLYLLVLVHCSPCNSWKYVSQTQHVIHLYWYMDQLVTRSCCRLHPHPQRA